MEKEAQRIAIHLALGHPASELRWRFYWGSARIAAESYKSQASAESARIQLAEDTLMPTEAVESYDRPVEFEDYYNDLNAMHEAENWLKEQPDNQFSKTCIYSYDTYLCRHFGPRATAAQRAEAFLKVLNLWVE